MIHIPETIVDAVLPDWPLLSPETRAAVLRNSTRFVCHQLSLAPFQIRLGFHILLTAFRLYALLQLGPRRLDSVSQAERGKALMGFSSLPLPMAGSLERVLRSLTLVAYLEDPLVTGAMGENPSLCECDVGPHQSP